MNNRIGKDRGISSNLNTRKKIPSNSKIETETLLMMLEGTMLYVLQNGSKNTLLVLDNILKKFDI